MLEQIVRPFESPTPLSQTIVIAQVQRVAQAEARLTWGAVGALPAANTGGFKVIDCDDKYKMTGATPGQKQRIENPNDSTEFVVFQNLKTVSFEHQAKDDPTISYQKTQTVYGPPQLTGALVPHISVVTDDQKLCKAEYDFTDPISPFPA